MKMLFTLLLGTALLVGCSDGSDNGNSPPPQPPVGPGPVDPPQPPMMQSFSAFFRTVFADPADAEPRDVNALEFVQDAQDDDFADLLH